MKKPAYIQSAHKVTPDFFVDHCGFDDERAKRVTNALLKFPFLAAHRSQLYDLKMLWSEVGKPYGEFRKWKDRVIEPLFEELGYKIISTKKELKSLGVDVSFVSKKGQTKSGNKNAEKDFYACAEACQMLAMRVNTPEGYEVGLALIDAKDGFREVMFYNHQRQHMEQTAKTAAHFMATKDGGFDVAALGETKKVLNRLTCDFVGSRNDSTTDRDAYLEAEAMFAQMLMRGKTPAQIRKFMEM